MLKRVVSSFGLVAAVGLAYAATSSADVSVAQPPQQVGIDACLTAAADQTKGLASGKTNVSITQPNVTPVPGSTPPPRACKSSYVADFTVASTSTPPSGFTEHFNVSASWGSGAVVDSKGCLATRPEVKIYKKTSGDYAWVGGGALAPTFHPETTPPSCTFAEQPGFKAVIGKVPSNATETYRVLVSFAGVGGSVSSVARIAK